MLYRLVSWILLLRGSLALGLGGYSYFSDDGGHRLVALESNLKVPDCPIGEVHRLSIRLRNHYGRPVRIIGVEEC